MYEITIRTEFAAAHSLRNYRGACEALHGHNWKVEVSVTRAETDETGLAVDFKDLREKTNRIIAGLDHTCLNETEHFRRTNPTSENIARFIFKELGKMLEEGVTVRKVTVWETDDAAASYHEN